MMSLLKRAALAALFACVSAPVMASTDLNSVPDRFPAPLSAASTISLPLETLNLGREAHVVSLDRAKSRAEMTGVYIASSQFVQNDGKASEPVVIEANLASIGPAISSVDPMNIRFYGTLLVFAAGCIMYLGLMIRRHP